jgi:hypothetical protein
MAEIKINLNESVKFKLTPLGADIYYHRYDDLNKRIIRNGGQPLSPSLPRVDDEGYTSMQLWHFMEIYGGEHMGLTKPNVIKPLEIIYTTDDKGE